MKGFFHTLTGAWHKTEFYAGFSALPTVAMAITFKSVTWSRHAIILFGNTYWSILANFMKVVKYCTIAVRKISLDGFGVISLPFLHFGNKGIDGAFELFNSGY